MYIYIYIYIYVHMCVCTHIYSTYVYVCIYIYIYREREIILPSEALPPTPRALVSPAACEGTSTVSCHNISSQNFDLSLESHIHIHRLMCSTTVNPACFSGDHACKNSKP